MAKKKKLEEAFRSASSLVSHTIHKETTENGNGKYDPSAVFDLKLKSPKKAK